MGRRRRKTFPKAACVRSSVVVSKRLYRNPRKEGRKDIRTWLPSFLFRLRSTVCLFFFLLLMLQMPEVWNQSNTSSIFNERNTINPIFKSVIYYGWCTTVPCKPATNNLGFLKDFEEQESIYRLPIFAIRLLVLLSETTSDRSIFEQHSTNVLACNRCKTEGDDDDADEDYYFAWRSSSISISSEVYSAEMMMIEES